MFITKMGTRITQDSIDYGNSRKVTFAHFARMQSSIALLERAMTGKVFLRRNGMQASHSVRPSVLRKVDRIAVGIPDAGFRLAVGRSFLDVGRGAPLLAHRNQGLDALHLETEMIDPLLELIALDFAFGADRDDRQVDVTVGEIGGGPHALDDLEAERIGVEFHQSIHVLRENGEMADAGH